MSYSESIIALENWKRIPKHPDYEVSDLGRIRSYKSWRGLPVPRLLRQTPADYPFVTVDNVPGRRVHVLVLETFVGPRPKGGVARHLDGNRFNNRLENLAWGTASENEADKFRHGRANQGERHGMAKLSKIDIAAIRSDTSHSQRELAVMFGVSPGYISEIRSNKVWRHL